jgi:putative ABC transport system permease protein
MKNVRGMLGRKLQRKLVRDISSSKGLFLAVTAVIFLGVTFFGATFMGYQNLKSSYDYSYDVLNFADFTIKVVQAPPETADELRSIPGVKAVTARANIDMALVLPGEEGKRVLGRVISLPSDGRAAVNDVKVESGSYFEAGDDDVLLVEKSFAKRHGLEPGDTMVLRMDDRDVSFGIAGIVTSPEYIWPAKSRQEILVSPETFGVVFVPEGALPRLVGDSMVNEFAFTVKDGADRDAVITAAKAVLTPYVIMDVVPREDQASNTAVKMDLDEMGEFAEIFPLLFLIVGALATYIFLTRIVHNQRAQIGLMRAIGYSRSQVLRHYLGYALIIGVVGAVAGTIAGYLLSEVVTKFYVSMLGLPYTQIQVHWLGIEEGMVLGIIPCAIAGLIPAYAASRLKPAEAMRTPAPAAGRRLLVERLFPFLKRLSFTWKIPLRNVFRNRRRSLYTVIGVAFGVSLILVSAAFIDSIGYFLDLQFDRIQRYDALVNFSPTQPQPATVADEVRTWDDVESAEPILQVPVRLLRRDEAYSTVMVGLEPGSQLYGLYSPSGDSVDVSDRGILLASALEKTLDTYVGDVITVVSPYDVRQLVVAGFVQQAMGSFAFISLERAQEFLGGQPVISGIMLDVTPEGMGTIREQAYALPGTASVELTSESSDRVFEQMGFIRNMMWIMLAFGAMLALAIVFTTVTVNILERRREIATMRTLGQGKGGIASMITVENLLLGLIGLIPGLPLGYLLAVYMFRLFHTEAMTFYLWILPTTYVWTAALVMAIMLVSQVPGIRHINRLDLARVIKEQST